MQKYAKRAKMGAIVIQILVIAALQCSVTPLQPKLSSRTTKDLKFHCDMEGFNAPMSSLLSLQIAKRAENTNGQDAILATVDSGEAWLSHNVTERDEHRHYVSGRLDLSQKRNAWLELTITDITPQEYGMYSFYIHYTDHPADTKHSTWSKELFVDETVSEARESGFRIRLSKGVHIECDSGVLDETDGHVTQMNISALKSEIHWFASWCENTNTSTCSPELLGPYHHGQRRSANEGILEVHIPDATCHHQSKHVCAVTTSSGKTMNFSSERLPLEECQQRLETEPSAADKTNTGSTYVASSSTEDLGASRNAIIGTAVSVVFIFIALGLVVLYRRRNRSKDNSQCVCCTTEKLNSSGASETPSSQFVEKDNFGKDNTEKTNESRAMLLVETEDDASKAKVKDNQNYQIKEKQMLLPTRFEDADNTSLSNCGTKQSISNDPNSHEVEINTKHVYTSTDSSRFVDRNTKRTKSILDTKKVHNSNEDEEYGSNNSAGNSGDSSPDSEQPFEFPTSNGDDNHTPESLEEDININKRIPHSYTIFPQQLVNETQRQLHGKDKTCRYASGDGYCSDKSNGGSSSHFDDSFGLSVPVQATDDGCSKIVVV